MACIYQPTGVRVFFEELIRHGKDIRAMGNARLAVIGEGTKKALKERGLLADLCRRYMTGILLERNFQSFFPVEKRYLSRGQKG
mgnify:CR=1 FL=1